MELPQVNYLAVLVGGLAIFMLGGLWYSPLLFAKRWMALMGFTEAHVKAAMETTSMPLQYLSVFICGLVSSWSLAVVLGRFAQPSVLQSVAISAVCWLGFAGATSYGTAIFSMKPKQLWLINSGFNLVSFMMAGAILGAWR